MAKTILDAASARTSTVPASARTAQETSLIATDPAVSQGTPISIFDGVYTKFDPIRDVVSNNKENVTEAIWTNGSGTMNTFYTSSIQSASNAGLYYINVYQENPQTVTTAVPQFAIAYGHYLGSGSAPISSYGSNNSLTPSKAVYSQYANLLTPSTQTQFSINGASVNEIIALNINRGRFKESIDPGNWELCISGSKANSRITITDMGVDPNYLPSYIDGNRVYSIASGSIANGISGSANPTYYGLLYPDHGIIILNAAAISSSVGISFNRTQVANTNNNLIFYRALSGSNANPSYNGNYFTARNAQSINSTYYYVRLFNSQYNFSNNPTFTTGSYGDLKFKEMVKDPKVYVTTIGLYNDNNELLAVAKISKALLKTFNSEATITVKLDF